MKRPILLVGLLFSLGVVVPGCPVYNEDGCNEDAHCAPGYVCELLTGECVEPAPMCERPSDCSTGATCDREGRCRSVDCSWEDVGCVRGYTCVRDDGVWRCVDSGDVRPGTGGESSAGGQPGYGGDASQGGAAPSPGGASQGGAGPSAGGQPAITGGASSGGSDAGAGGVSSGGAPGAGGAPDTGGAGSGGQGGA